MLQASQNAPPEKTRITGHIENIFYGKLPIQ